MSFRVAQKTLQRMEWPQVVALLRESCATPQAAARLAPGEDAGTAASEASPSARPGGLFEATLEGTRGRLAETSEARALLDAEELPPLHGITTLAPSLARARKGGGLEPQQLLAVRATLGALHATAGYLASRADRAPRLAEIGASLPDDRPLERRIERCIDPAGEVRDEASTALASARHDAHRLAGELQSRLEGYLRNADVTSYLSDRYFTVRSDRYVLPVKADFRSKVPGIVHDASNTGTTLFIEPQGVVELNNRLKQAQLTAQREVQRILRELSEEVARAAPELERGLDGLADVDLAFARGRLSQRMNGVEPEIDPTGGFWLPQLRHPLLAPDEAVANDLELGDRFQCLVISGPNAGGKTVAMKALGLAALFARSGLHVPADAGARVGLVDAILCDIGDGQDIGEHLSTFSAHVANLAQIVRFATDHSLVLLDEVGVGTDPGEGAALAQAVLETLADHGARLIATTHYNLLKEMADADERFSNASVEFDPQTLAPTYRLHLGVPGASSATAVAARMGMPNAVLDRANALLDREDRRLDRLLSELSANRAALDEEQRAVSRLRVEGEAVRAEYRTKLLRLQERRDALYKAMREDLDRAFKDAHGQIAAVIRGLQRGGQATAQEAARARERLLALENRAQEAESEAGVGPSALTPEADHPATIDWQQIAPGDPVTVPGGRSGQLESLPDGRGRARVRVGGVALVVAADQLRAGAAGAPARRAAPRIHVESELVSGGGRGTLHGDLRGMRVDDALDRLDELVDRALAEGSGELHVVHGFGTGALRRAVRDHLRDSPYVSQFRAGDPDEGGDGITVANIGGG